VAVGMKLRAVGILGANSAKVHHVNLNNSNKILNVY
jgi:hypothetical protein